MAMVVTVARLPYSSAVDITRRRARLVFNSLSAKFTSSSSSSSAFTSRKLVLYSKPGCCLCDGLKEKLHAAFSLSSPDPLHDVDLQIRDITSNVEWEKAYQYEIPVLTRVLPDGTEEVLPRLSPRLGVEMIQKKIAAAFRQ
ncbi:uncharacterized protein LOC124927172 [Impatiens glandulifera]|uniref:uncharacterized protein LOC124927172 n=1 Tax=Impatiens glandulifera TaxID=253017 RepID=UPI001FB0A845|nr:uncharacterized protein LOC124927172 [Impatiens glandulifera]